MEIFQILIISFSIKQDKVYNGPWDKLYNENEIKLKFSYLLIIGLINVLSSDQAIFSTYQYCRHQLPIKSLSRGPLYTLSCLQLFLYGPLKLSVSLLDWFQVFVYSFSRCMELKLGIKCEKVSGGFYSLCYRLDGCYLQIRIVRDT